LENGRAGVVANVIFVDFLTAAATKLAIGDDG